MLPESGPAGPASSGPNLTRPGMSGCAENFVSRVDGLESQRGRVRALLLGERVARLVRLDQRGQVADLAEARSALERPGVRGGTSDPDQQGQHQEQQGMKQNTQAPRRDRAEGVRIIIAARSGAPASAEVGRSRGRRAVVRP